MQIISPLKDPGIIHVDTLSNGIRIFHRQAEQSFGLPKLAMCVLVQAGGRDDPKGREGVAHFFEHMPFRGTKHFPSLADLTYSIESNGGYINAFTTDEATGYEIIVPNTLIEDGIQRLSDMLLHPILREPEIEIERNVIIEELRNKLGSVNFFARQELYKGLLGDHPLVHAVVGTEDALKRIEKSDLLAFHQRYYNANTISLFFTGAYDPQELLALCERSFGAIKPGAVTDRAETRTKKQTPDTEKVFTPTQYNRSVYLLGRVLPAVTRRESTIIRIFIDMLTRGMNSPLNEEIREKRGLAYNLGFAHETYADTSVLTFFVSTRFAQMDTVDGLVWDSFHTILKNEKRFHEVKHMRKQSALYHEYSTGALIDSAVDQYLDYGDVMSLNDRMVMLESISLSEVINYAEKMLTRDAFLNIRVNCDAAAA